MDDLIDIFGMESGDGAGLWFSLCNFVFVSSFGAGAVYGDHHHHRSNGESMMMILMVAI